MNGSSRRNSGIRRILCTSDEVHVTTMATNKVATAPKTASVSSPTTMSHQLITRTFKSNVASADSKGSGGSSDSLTGTKEKKNHGGSMKIKTLIKTAKTDSKLNSDRINSNPSPNSKSSSRSASSSSQTEASKESTVGTR